MALQYSGAVRDAKNDAIETTISTTPTLKIYTGSPPANCGTAATGTEIATGALPSDWLAASSGGVKAKAGAWTVTGIAAAGAGTAGGYFRIIQGATCHIQGTFGAASDMVPDNNSIANGQVVTVSTFQITSGNA